jgi:hypothetical protein
VHTHIGQFEFELEGARAFAVEERHSE